MIGPFIAVFAVHNWDVRAALLPSENDTKEIEESLKSVMGEPSENMFSIGSAVITGNTIRVSIQFTSPAKIPITIKEITATISDQGVEIGQAQMEEDEVEVPPGATVNFTLVGTYSGAPPTNPQLSKAVIKLECYGVTVQAQLSAEQGGS
jgi:hypothetical protein